MGKEVCNLLNTVFESNFVLLRALGTHGFWRKYHEVPSRDVIRYE